MAKEPDEQAPPTLAEFNDEDYCRDVLQLDEHMTEDTLDQELLNDAAIYGIEMAPSKAHISVCDSMATIESAHARTGSMASCASLSTNATSRSSSDDLKSHERQSPSFSDYDRYLQRADSAVLVAPPMPPEPAPSIFSVSTRKSYSSIKSGISSRFRGFRRMKASNANMK